MSRPQQSEESPVLWKTASMWKLERVCVKDAHGPKIQITMGIRVYFQQNEHEIKLTQHLGSSAL